MYAKTLQVVKIEAGIWHVGATKRLNEPQVGAARKNSRHSRVEGEMVGKCSFVILLARRSCITVSICFPRGQYSSCYLYLFSSSSASCLVSSFNKSQSEVERCSKGTCVYISKN